MTYNNDNKIAQKCHQEYLPLYRRRGLNILRNIFEYLVNFGSTNEVKN